MTEYVNSTDSDTNLRLEQLREQLRRQTKSIPNSDQLSKLLTDTEILLDRHDQKAAWLRTWQKGAALAVAAFLGSGVDYLSDSSMSEVGSLLFLLALTYAMVFTLLKGQLIEEDLGIAKLTDEYEAQGINLKQIEALLERKPREADDLQWQADLLRTLYNLFAKKSLITA